jgi:hypothetical protein
MMTASLRATATAAMCGPRRPETRWKKARRGLGPRTACQAASTSMVRATLLGDVPVPGLACAGRRHGWVQAEVGNQAVRAGEPSHGSDRGDEPNRDHHVNARDRHQPRDVQVGSGLARQLALDDLQVFAEAVVLAQVSADGLALVARQWLRQQPCSPLRPEQVGVGTGRHEVSVQDRLHHGRQPRPLPHDLKSVG